MKSEHMQSATGNLRESHTTSHSWFSSLLLKGDKRNPQNFKRTVAAVAQTPERRLRKSQKSLYSLYFWANTSTMKMLNVDLLVLSFCLGLGTGYRTSSDSTVGKRQYQIQNGPCSYTFLLPEQENCQTQSSNYNPIQKDGPADSDESTHRLEQLEIIMENNTQWLLKVKLCPPIMSHPWYNTL